jgi:hypothetical protein
MAESTRFDLSQAVIFSTRVSPDLDPRLQWHVARRQAGMVKAASTSTAVDEVAVVARVSSPADWEALSEVRQPTLIGLNPENDYIVIGRIPIRRIEAVRGQSFVKSLKAAQMLRPFLNATTQETDARPTLLPASHLSNGGAGVVVGVIDYGEIFPLLMWTIL